MATTRSRLRGLLVAAGLVMSCAVSPENTATASKKTDEIKIVAGWLDKDQLARLQKAAPTAKFVAVDSAEAALAEMDDADALLGVLSRELIQAGVGKELRWVQVYSAGVDRYRYPELIDSESIVMTNAKIIQGPNVADQALALLLAMTRGIHRVVALKDTRDWRGTRKALRAPDKRPVELAGKTALVVGLGGIGTAIAARAHGFGMTIIAVSTGVDKPRPDFITSVAPPSQLLAELPKADVIFLAVPLTPETTNMLDAEAFAKVKKGAFLVNIARGKVIDTDAMVAALQDGTLAGAGLDVTEPEPLPSDHPLWTLDNVVITPHMGGTSDQVWERRMELLEDNVRRFVAKQPLRNVVDKKKGY